MPLVAVLLLPGAAGRQSTRGSERVRQPLCSLLPCLSECGALSFISSGVRVDHSKSSCRRPPVRDPPVCLAVVRNMDSLVVGQPCFILYDGEWRAVQYFSDVYAGLKFAFPGGTTHVVPHDQVPARVRTVHVHARQRDGESRELAHLTPRRGEGLKRQRQRRQPESSGSSVHLAG